MLGTAVTQIEGCLLVVLFSLHRSIILRWAIGPRPLLFLRPQVFLVTKLQRGRLLLLLLPLLEHHDIRPGLLPPRFFLCLDSSC